MLRQLVATPMAAVFLLLLFCVSTALAQYGCEKSGLIFDWWDDVDVWLVLYDFQPCNGHDSSHYICEGSGWGNEEATVVCRERGYMYGLGRYIRVQPFFNAIRHIRCEGYEARLADCDIQQFSSEPCSSLAVVTHCSYVPQVFVTNLTQTEWFPNHLTVTEDKGSIHVCVAVVGAGSLFQPLQVCVATVKTTAEDFQSATVFDDYRPLTQTLTFQPFMTPEQCLDIEIIDDSLAEPWEIFSLHLYTETQYYVEVATPLVHLYIPPNDMESSPPILSNPRSVSTSPNYIPSSSISPAVDSLYTTSTPIPSSVSPTAGGGEGGATTGGGGASPAGLVAGVTVAVVVLVLAAVAALVLVPLILWMRRKTKRLSTSRNTAAPPNSTPGAAESEDEERFSLSNPTYQPTAHQAAGRPGTPEHQFTNPLYSAVEVAGPSDSTRGNVDYEYVDAGSSDSTRGNEYVDAGSSDSTRGNEYVDAGPSDSTRGNVDYEYVDAGFNRE